MPSQEFQAFYAAAVAAAGPEPVTLAERRKRMEEAKAHLPTADGVLVTSIDASGVPVLACTREDALRDPVFLYFHGGGYRQGSATSYRSFGSFLAQACSVQVLLVDYRLAPEHPFPSAVDDALRAYRWLIEDRQSSERVIIAGDSAGGGLASALVLRVRAEGMALPSGLVCLSPWTDLTNTGASYIRCAETDRIFSKLAADEVAALYLNGADPANPFASPLLGDWSGLPPLFIQASGCEVLADDAIGLAENARNAGVDVELHIYPDMPHVWQLNYPRFPEAVQAVDEIKAFVARITAGSS